MASRSILAAALLGVALGLSAFEVESLPLHLRLSALSRATPPEVVSETLVLSFEGAHRFVGAAFEYENFAAIHPFERNERGVFVLAFPIPRERREPLAYRLVVDGVWIVDPANPRRIFSRSAGVELSVAEVPFLDVERLGVYRVIGEDGRTARFLWKGAPGELVAVAGDFNRWDPFIHELEEVRPGVYRLDVPLEAGVHYYNFVVRGQYLADPLNMRKASTREGRVVSVLAAGDESAAAPRRR